MTSDEFNALNDKVDKLGKTLHENMLALAKGSQDFAIARTDAAMVRVLAHGPAIRLIAASLVRALQQPSQNPADTAARFLNEARALAEAAEANLLASTLPDAYCAEVGQQLREFAAAVEAAMNNP